MLLFFDHPPSTSAKQELLAARVNCLAKGRMPSEKKKTD
jgi:hypothetical protein